MPPYLLLSLLLGAAYGALFHLWRGKNVRDLAIYVLAGIIGFALGQSIANLLGFDVFMIGPLHVAEATATAWAGLFLVYWLRI